MAIRTTGVTQVVVVVTAAIVGLVPAAWFAAVVYLEFWASDECHDLVERGMLLNCAAPAAPWWVLLLGAVAGGFVSVTVATRALRAVAAHDGRARSSQGS